MIFVPRVAAMAKSAASVVIEFQCYRHRNVLSTHHLLRYSIQIPEKL